MVNLLERCERSNLPCNRGRIEARKWGADAPADCLPRRPAACSLRMARGVALTSDPRTPMTSDLDDPANAATPRPGEMPQDVVVAVSADERARGQLLPETE